MQLAEVIGTVVASIKDPNLTGTTLLLIQPLGTNGQGVGRTLVKDFEQQVAARGGLTITLGSDDEDDMTSLAGADLYDNLPEKISNIRNLKGHPYEFYLKCGYRITGVVPDANGRGKPDILMAKRIDPKSH